MGALVAREVQPADRVWISQAVHQWDATYRWNVSGMTPTPESISRMLWDRVVLQHALVDRGDVPRGLVQLHDLDLRSSFGYISALLGPTAEGLADVPAAVQAFLRVAMGEFPLRRLYLEVLSDELAIMGALGHHWAEEARLVEHERRGAAAFVDLLVFSSSLGATVA